MMDMHLVYAITLIAGLFVLSLASENGSHIDSMNMIENVAARLSRFIPFSKDNPDVREELEIPQLEWNEQGVKQLFTQIWYGGFLCNQSFDRLVGTASQLVSGTIIKIANDFDEMPEEIDYLAREIAKSLTNDIGDPANDTELTDHVKGALDFIISMKSAYKKSPERFYDWARKQGASRLKDYAERFFSEENRTHLLRMIRFSNPHLALVLSFPEISFKYLGNLAIFELESLTDIENELEKRYSETGSLKHRDGSLQAWDIHDIYDLFSEFERPEFTFGGSGKLTKDRIFEMVSDLGKYVSEERFKQQLNDLELLGVNEEVLKILKSPEDANTELKRFASELGRVQRQYTNTHSSHWHLENELAEERHHVATLRKELEGLSKKLENLNLSLEKVTHERDELKSDKEHLEQQLAARVDPESIDYTIGFLQRNYLQKIDSYKPTNFFFDDEGKVIKTLKERFDPPNLAPLLKTVEDCLKAMESKIQRQYNDLTNTTKTVVSLWTQALPDAEAKQLLASKLATFGFNHETGVFDYKSTKASDFYKLITSFDLKSLVEEAAAKLTAGSNEQLELMGNKVQELLNEKALLAHELDQEKEAALQQTEEFYSLQNSLKALKQEIGESNSGPSLFDELQQSKDVLLKHNEHEELEALKSALRESLGLNTMEPSTFTDSVQSSIKSLNSLKNSILGLASQIESTEDVGKALELLRALPQRNQELEQNNVRLASQLSEASLERERLSFMQGMIDELKKKLSDKESSIEVEASQIENLEAARDAAEVKYSALLSSLGNVFDFSNIDDAKAFSQLGSLASSLKSLKTSVTALDESLIGEDWIQSLSSYLQVNANEWKQLKELQQVIPTLQVMALDEIKQTPETNPSEASASLSYAKVISKAAETMQRITDEKLSLSEELGASIKKVNENAAIISKQENRVTELQDEVFRLSKRLQKKDEFIEKTLNDLSDEALQTAQNLFQSEELKYENETLRQSVAKISEHANGALLLVKEKDDLLARLEQEYVSKTEAIKRENDLKLSESQERLKNAEAIVESQQKSIQETKQELEAAKIEKDRLEALEKQLEELKSQEVLQKIAIETLQESESRLKEVIALQKDDALQEVTQRLEKIIQEKADLDKALVDSQEAIRSLKNDISSLSSEMELNKQLLLTLKEVLPADKSNPVEALNDLIKTQETREAELLKLQETLKSKEAAINDAESKMRTFEESNGNLRGQLEVNSTLLETYSKIIGQLSKLVSTATSSVHPEVGQLHEDVEKAQEKVVHTSQTAIDLEQRISEVIETSTKNEKLLRESKASVLLLESQLTKFSETLQASNVEHALIAAQTLRATTERNAVELVELKDDLKPLLDPTSHPVADAASTISDLKTLIIDEMKAKKSESDSLQATLEIVKEENAILQDDLIKLSSERKSLLHELGIPLQQNEISGHEATENNDASVNILTTVHLLMEEKAKMNAEFKKLQEQYAAMVLEVTNSKSTLKNSLHLDSIEDAVTRISRLSQQNTILQEQLSDLQRVARGREALSKSLHEQIVQLEAKINELSSEIVLVKTENAKMEESKESSIRETLALKEGLEKANGFLEQLQEENKSLQKQEEQAKQVNKNLHQKHDKIMSEISQALGLPFKSEETLLAEAAEIKTIQDQITQAIYLASDDETHVPSWKIVVRQVQKDLDEFMLMKTSIAKIGLLASELSGDAITSAHSPLSPLKALEGLESNLQTIQRQIQQQHSLISYKDANIQHLQESVAAKDLEASKVILELETLKELQQQSHITGHEVLASQVAHLTALTETMTNEKQLLQNQIDSIKDDHLVEVEKLQQQVQKHIGAEKVLQESNSELTNEISHLKKQFELQNASLSEQHVETERLREEYNSLKKLHDNLESSLKSLLQDGPIVEPAQNVIDDSEDIIATLGSYLSDLDRDRKSLVEAVTRVQEEKTLAEKHYEELVTELQEIIPQVTPLNAKVFAASFTELTETIKSLQPLTLATDGIAGLKASLSLAKSKIDDFSVLENSLDSIKSTLDSLLEDAGLAQSGIPNDDLDSSLVSILTSIEGTLEQFKDVQSKEAHEKRNLLTEIQQLTSELEVTKASEELAKSKVQVLLENSSDDLKARVMELSDVNHNLSQNLEATYKELETLKSSNDSIVRARESSGRQMLQDLESKSEEIRQLNNKVSELQLILEETQTAFQRYRIESEELVSSLEDQLTDAHISETESPINFGNQNDGESVSSKSLYADHGQKDVPHKTTDYSGLSDTKTFWDNRSIPSQYNGRHATSGIPKECIKIIDKFQNLEDLNDPDLAIDDECWPFIADDLISNIQDFQVARITATQWTPGQLELIQPEAAKYLRIDKWPLNDGSLEMCNALSKDQIASIESNPYMNMHYQQVCVNG